MAKLVSSQKLVLSSEELFKEAQKYIPGGVNSPVRSFQAVGGRPLFIAKGKGARIYSEEGKELIDYCLSWGALIFGHAPVQILQALKEALEKGTSFGTATRKEIELAELIVEAVPSIEQVRLTNSGTEAVMTAVRLARAYTGRNKLIKFEGSYHGHADYLLVKAGSGISTLGIAGSLGVPRDFVRHTLILPYNNLSKVREVVRRYQKSLAGIIVEPVAGNSGVILPEIEFLQGLREICFRYHLVLIFDEVITGFRLSYSGAQGYFGIQPDLTCLGKIVGGGLPLAGLGGRRDIMRLLAPEGGVYQAGTLAGNPLAVSAGIASLKLLKKMNPYQLLSERTEWLTQEIEELARRYRINLRINRIASLFSLFFSSREVRNYQDALSQNLNLFRKFYLSLLEEGVYFSPSGFEANFLSTAHQEEDLRETVEKIEKVFQKIGRR